MGNENNKSKPTPTTNKNTTLKSIGPFGILPCTNLGIVLIPEKKSYRLDINKDHLFGTTSPLSPITLGDDAKEMAKIPVHAKSFLYCYPLTGIESSLKLLNQNLSIYEKFAVNGGFVYLDETGKVVMINAIDNEAGNDLMFDEVQPFNDDLEKISSLNKEGRFQPVTFETLISKGFQKYSWILPGEKTTSGSVLCSHGAFMYISNSGCFYFPVRDTINYGKYTAIWEWSNKNVWQVYDLATTLILEEAYKNKREVVTLNHGIFNGSYVVNLKGEFTQTNLKTNFVRPVRRLKGEVTTHLATWECLVQKKWVPYDKKINEILESRFFAACLSLMPSTLTLDYGFAVSSPYTIDLVEMTQKNTATGFVRTIRRQVDASVEPPDDPNAIEPSERWGLRALHVIDYNFVPPDMRKPCCGQIAIHIKSGHNIAGNQPHPFVVVTTTFSSFIWSSTWKFKTNAPIWNESCVIPVNSENQRGEVVFTVYDKQWTNNSYLGKVVVSLKDITSEKEISGNMKFNYECRSKVDKEESPSMLNLTLVFNEARGTTRSQINFSYLLNLKAKLIMLAKIHPLLYNQPLDPQWQNLIKSTIYEIEDPDIIEGMSGNKYNFGSCLGQGSYTIVKKAQNIVSGNTVAIKIIEKQFNASRDEQFRITNEIAFLYILSHLREDVADHFTQLMDLQETADSLYIVMPFCHCDLFNLVEESLEAGNGVPIIDEPRIKRVAIDVLQGLFFLHTLGICHRDIKPENILYDPLSQKWKLADFGISGFVHDEEGLHGNIGTLPYMAPEMFKGTDYTIAIDMWATGVTIFVVLSAQFPWVCETEDIQEAILGREITFSSRWDKVKEGTGFVLKLMDPEPSQRLTVMGALCHPWLEQESKEVVQRLEKFIKKDDKK